MNLNNEQSLEQLELFYFGTDTENHGHYFWRIDKDRMSCKTLSFPLGEGIDYSMSDKWPFHPERVLKSEKKGDVEFYNINGYSVLAIVGSCIDERGGTKSIFFACHDFNYEQMIKFVLRNETARKIIDKMPFIVNW